MIIAMVSILGTIVFYSGRNNSTALATDKEGSNSTNIAGEAVSLEVPKLIDSVVNAEISKLSANLKDLYNDATATSPASLLESLADSLYKSRTPLLSAKIKELMVTGQEKPDVKKVKEASERYFEASQLYQQANASLNTVKACLEANMQFLESLKLNERSDADLRIMQAQTLFALSTARTGTLDPAITMQGVTILREVVAQDPKNLKAQRILGYLAMESGQYDKAVERFRILTQTAQPSDPEYPYYFNDLGRALLETHQHEEAEEALKKYRTLLPPTAVKLREEVDQLLKSAANHSH